MRNELSALLCSFPFATMHLLRRQAGLRDAIPLSIIESLPLSVLRSIEQSDETQEEGQNVPLLTIMFLHASLSGTNGGIDVGTSTAVMGALKELTEQLTALERIRDSEYLLCWGSQWMQLLTVGDLAPIPLILNLQYVPPEDS